GIARPGHDADHWRRPSQRRRFPGVCGSDIPHRPALPGVGVHLEPADRGLLITLTRLIAAWLGCGARQLCDWLLQDRWLLRRASRSGLSLAERRSGSPL